MILQKTVAAVAVIATGWLSLLAGASAIEGHPDAQCVLNAEKTRITVPVSNSGPNSYGCTATCTYTIQGERALHRLRCNFALGANAAERIACEEEAQFTELRSSEYICEPR